MIVVYFSLSCIGEGNGNPLQCSCLENPRDGGAWWASICGATQSRTRLKRLSSSSSSSSSSHEVMSNSSTTPWAVACQTPLPMRFSRQECCSGLLFPPPGDLPDPGIEPGSPALQADSLPPEPPGRANCRLEALLISKRLLTVPCHVGFSTGPLRTQQLTSAKAARETEN